MLFLSTTDSVKKVKECRIGKKTLAVMQPVKRNNICVNHRRIGGDQSGGLSIGFSLAASKEFYMG